MTGPLKFVTGLGVALLLAGCGSASSDPGEATAPLRAAVDTCSERYIMELGDNDHTLIISAKEAEDFVDVDCVTETLGTPQSLLSQIDHTNALMGQQKESAGGYTYAWSYHPDNGLNMTITED